MSVGPALWTHADPGFDLQCQADVAVVIPTLLRPTLVEALRSVFAQAPRLRIQVLLGVDVPRGDPSVVEAACRERPPHVAVQVLYPGYSTRAASGGLSPVRPGGVLRTVLSYLANTPFIAYLDDDNWWAPGHLRQLLDAIAPAGAPPADWAFSLRWFVHPRSRRPICIDSWESVGPGAGVFDARYGGYVDPSCLMLNKLRCGGVLPLWNVPVPDDGHGGTTDRTVFHALSRHHRGAATSQASAFYEITEADEMQPMRLRRMGERYAAAGREVDGRP